MKILKENNIKKIEIEVKCCQIASTGYISKLFSKKNSQKNSISISAQFVTNQTRDKRMLTNKNIESYIIYKRNHGP